MFKLSIPFLNRGRYFASTLKRDDVVFGGVVAAFFLFLFLLGFAAYLFYSTVMVEREELAGVVRGEIIQGKDIDEVVKILDERAQKSEEILRD